MIAKELIARLSSRTGMTKEKTTRLMEATATGLTQTLTAGNVVQWMNLGTLENKERPARTSVHPKTGEKHVTPAKQVITFRPSVSLKESLK